jgi:hypothetical protein
MAFQALLNAYLLIGRNPAFPFVLVVFSTNISAMLGRGYTLAVLARLVSGLWAAASIPFAKKTSVVRCPKERRLWVECY